MELDRKKKKKKVRGGKLREASPQTYTRKLVEGEA